MEAEGTEGDEAEEERVRVGDDEGDEEEEEEEDVTEEGMEALEKLARVMECLRGGREDLGEGLGGVAGANGLVHVLSCVFLLYQYFFPSSVENSSHSEEAVEDDAVCSEGEEEGEDDAEVEGEEAEEEGGEEEEE